MEGQIFVSIGAILCAGTSFLSWLFVMSDGRLSQLALQSRKPYILSQIIAGVLILTGLIGSLVLAIYRPTFEGGKYFQKFLFSLADFICTDSSRPVLTVEIGFLLLLPTTSEVLIFIYNIDTH